MGVRHEAGRVRALFRQTLEPEPDRKVREPLPAAGVAA